MPIKMARGSLLVTFLLLVCSIGSSWSVSFSVFVRKDEAHQVLKIHKRANYFLEEIHPGNLERECIEETCSFEEAKEIFQSQEKTMEFWFDYKDLNPCKENPCKNGGVCKLKHYDYYCVCPPTFGGKQCELEKFECWYKNGGCWQYCQDTADSLRVVCSCAEGYALDDDGKRCMQSAQFPCGLIKRSMRVLEDDDPGLNQLAEGGTVRLNGMAEEGTLRLNGTAEGDALRVKELTEGGNPGFNGTAERGVLRLNESVEGDNAGLNGTAERGTPGLNESAEGGTPGLNGTAERGALRLNESVEGDNTGLNGTAERGTPGLNESAEGGTPGLNGTAERGALRLNESVEGDNTGLNGTAERGAPGLNESAEGGSPGLNGTAERGDPRLNRSAEGQNVHDGLSQAEAEGTLTDGDLHGWISSYHAAEHAETKITAGSFCHRGHCPWQVLIRNSRGYDFCGGSLISSRWVVTAAHCIDITRPHHVIVGDFDKHQREVKEQKIEVQQSWTHPHYDSDNYNGDIALLYLHSEVVFNEYVLPLCLPNPNLATLLTAEGTKGMVSGWGATYYKGPTNRFLMKVKLPIVSMETCRQSTEKLITDNMFCAGYTASAQDACKGDSGGPFAVSYHNTWYLLGIVSWGEGCAEEGKYGAYTRVGNYISWIKDVVENI